MTTYLEKNSNTLLTGASDIDGDTITIRRINGTQIASWPQTVDLTTGSVIVTQIGGITYDDEGDTTGHPLSGENQANGSFTFTLWDGIDESDAYTATISLTGANTAPTGQNQTLVFQV